jgi:hypothetical protein
MLLPQTGQILAEVRLDAREKLPAEIGAPFLSRFPFGSC